MKTNNNDYALILKTLRAIHSFCANISMEEFTSEVGHTTTWNHTTNNDTTAPDFYSLLSYMDTETMKKLGKWLHNEVKREIRKEAMESVKSLEDELNGEMNIDDVLLPGTIVGISDDDGHLTITCEVLGAVHLDYEQKLYEKSLLTGYSKCNNGHEQYRIKSDGPKYCPHCGSKLVEESTSFPTVHKFVERLVDSNLVRIYSDLAYHNTQYLM